MSVMHSNNKMTGIYHIQDGQSIMKPAPKGDVFWMLDADDETIESVRNWFEECYNLQECEQYWAKKEDGGQLKPAYWIIHDPEIAMAFKMRWC